MPARARPHGWAGPLFPAAWGALWESFYFLLKCFARLVLRTLFRVRRVEGPDELPEGGVLVCANHQSYLDPSFVQLALRRRATFVMTDDFYRVPLARWFFELVGAIPVDRSRRVRGSVVRAAALLRLGRVVAVFPEGKISPPGALGRAQRGIAVLARRGRVPVVPVAVDGGARAWGRGARWMRTSDVRIAVGPPRRYVGPPSRPRDQAFADEVREDIARLWDSIRARGPRPEGSVRRRRT
jgi:1-acyl-sn-glycerol-3-phosphate acyltransferase